MKWIKWTLIGAGVLLLLLTVLVVSFLATFDPNAYKSELAQGVREQTGRELSIPGDVSISYFPWLGFETGRVALGNAAGFDATPFAEIAGVRVKVEVLPLLRRTLSVDVIELSGLRVNLHKRADGRSNWDDLAAPAGAQDSGTKQADPGPGSEAPMLAALSVGGVRIRDAAVNYRDQQAGQEVALSGVDLSTGKVVPGTPFELSLNADARVAEPALTVALKLSATVTADPATQRYAVSDLDLNTELRGEPVPGGALSLALGGAATADLAASRASLEKLVLSTSGLAATVSGKVDKFDRDPAFDLALEVPAFDARALMKTLGLPPLDTADPQVLRKVSLQASVAGTLANVELKLLGIGLDDTQIEAAGDLRNLSRPGLPRMKLEASVSAIDLDRYLPPDAPEQADGGDAGGGAGDETPLGLPVDLLRELDATAELKIGRLTVKKLNAADIALVLRAKDGLVRLEPLSLALYEGLFNGRTTVDVRGAQPLFDVRAKLAGVKAGPLLADFSGDDMVHGRTDATLAINTRGETIGALKRGLNGSVELAFQNGAIKGFNLAESLRKAEAKLKKRDYTSEGDRPTDFSAVTVSGVFRDGVLHPDDLDLRSPLLRAGGKGSVDIAGETLDYLATVVISDDKTGEGGTAASEIKGLPIPVRVKGTFSDPKVSVELAKTLQAKARQKLEAKADEEKARLQAEADKKKAELEAKLEAEKTAAREKAEAEKKKAAEELKEKAKKKLQNLLQ